MREGKPVTMVMATEGTIEAKCSEKLAAILFMVHVVKAMQPLQKNSGGEVDLALFRPTHSDNTVITLNHRASALSALHSCSVISLIL